MVIEFLHWQWCRWWWCFVVDADACKKGERKKKANQRCRLQQWKETVLVIKLFRVVHIGSITNESYSFPASRAWVELFFFTPFAPLSLVSFVSLVHEKAFSVRIGYEFSHKDWPCAIYVSIKRWIDSIRVTSIANIKIQITSKKKELRKKMRSLFNKNITK